jgi:hypothetical protein
MGARSLVAARWFGPGVEHRPEAYGCRRPEEPEIPWLRIDEHGTAFIDGALLETLEGNAAAVLQHGAAARKGEGPACVIVPRRKT